MKIVIIGGSDAGISAALRIRELDKTIEPLIVTADSYPNFSICGIPFFIGNEIKDWRTLAHRTRDEIESRGIKLLLKTTVTKISHDRKTITIQSKSGEEKEIPYDKLIIGIGAVSAKPPIKGTDLPNVYFIRWIEESIVFKKHLEEKKPSTALIIGSGYIGMELAEGLLHRGIKVTIVEFLDTIIPTFDKELGTVIRHKLEEKGADIHTGISIESIQQDGQLLKVSGSNGFCQSTDLVIVATGAVPFTALAKDAGITMNDKNAILVNSRMETNIPDIYAAGDCIQTWHRILQKFVYLPLGTVSHKQGRIAGENAIGGKAEFKGALGTQSLKLFDLVAARTGLNHRDAQMNGFDPLTIEFSTWDHKVYYPGATKITIRMTGDRKTGLLLGVQVIGNRSAEISKRLDIAATAIYHSMKIMDLNDLDLSYTPPLSSPWDPIQMAAQDWVKKQV